MNYANQKTSTLKISGNSWEIMVELRKKINYSWLLYKALIHMWLDRYFEKLVYPWLFVFMKKYNSYIVRIAIHFPKYSINNWSREKRLPNPLSLQSSSITITMKVRISKKLSKRSKKTLDVAAPIPIYQIVNGWQWKTRWVSRKLIWAIFLLKNATVQIEATINTYEKIAIL